MQQCDSIINAYKQMIDESSKVMGNQRPSVFGTQISDYLYIKKLDDDFLLTNTLSNQKIYLNAEELAAISAFAQP